MIFDTQSKWNILIMNIVIGIDDLNAKLQIRKNFAQTLKFAPIFMKFGTHNKLDMLIMNGHHAYYEWAPAPL